jgi:hypothetical protein
VYSPRLHQNSQAIFIRRSSSDDNRFNGPPQLRSEVNRAFWETVCRIVTAVVWAIFHLFQMVITNLTKCDLLLGDGVHCSLLNINTPQMTVIG